MTATRDLWLDQDRWLTVGMQVPVMVNPSNPNDFAIDWAGVPSMAERAAANESSLADPLGAKIRVWEALTAHRSRLHHLVHGASGSERHGGHGSRHEGGVGRRAGTALSGMIDPATRQMLIEHFKSIGLDVDEPA